MTICIVSTVRASVKWWLELAVSHNPFIKRLLKNIFLWNYWRLEKKYFTFESNGISP